MKKIKLFILIVILGLSWSCTKISTSTLYDPVSSDATANATLVELQQGRTLYLNNCGRCHDLYSPDDFSASRWIRLQFDRIVFSHFKPGFFKVPSPVCGEGFFILSVK